MTTKASAAKFLESQQLPAGEPRPDWSTDELGTAAAAELASLLDAERSTSARYWHLGQLLTWARKPLNYGQWGQFLKKYKIDKSRAAKAMRIFRAFNTAEGARGLTVAEAYERGAKKKRARKPQQQKPPPPAAPDTSASVRSWSKFAELVTVVVEKQLDEPEFLSPGEASQSLAALQQILDVLRRCESRLKAVAEEKPVAETEQLVSGSNG